MLWEPRSPGRVFVDEIDTHLRAGELPLANFREADGTLHFNGFTFPAEFVSALEQLELSAAGLQQAGAVLALTSDRAIELEQLLPIDSSATGVTCAYEPGPTDWNRVDGIGGLFLPQRILHVICGWLDQGVR